MRPSGIGPGVTPPYNGFTRPRAVRATVGGSHIDFPMFLSPAIRRVLSHPRCTQIKREKFFSRCFFGTLNRCKFFKALHFDLELLLLYFGVQVHLDFEYSSLNEL